MRIISFIVALTITLALIIVLNYPLGSLPPLGKFISPQQGFWQNAEPVNKDFSASLNFPSLKKPADVFFDERLVPHVFVEDENDAYFIQGYLHAKFRLWQMEFQTHAAAGRLSEVLGPGPDSAYLNNDRNMRRLGMVYGAKRSLLEMEKDEDTKKEIDAYTDGVNNYISSLTESSLPLEYRLLNYHPEKWTNLKTSLFLKYMSYDLTGSENDIEYTNAKSFFSEEDFNKLYPAFQDSLDPIVPKGTVFSAPEVHPVAPADADTAYFNWKGVSSLQPAKTDKDNGSNNWAISGAKTKSGRPILCNDPHLGLNLPSLWYEMQISTPSYNSYGVSFPGAPAIIIGFNDSIAWGVTNAARDVRDYYKIQFRDKLKTQYLFNGQWKNAEQTVETYLMKDGSVLYDTVAYT
ncbi:MAG: penicillin acylase family protein, partial [Chitinophagaceae bacterium]|nr:penicillin acylase family protein [Chitinophagaceae bacterium]